MKGEKMKAIILAAGQGTRLKKYTENLPQGMLMFEGKTVIERQIEMYRKCGIEKTDRKDIHRHSQNSRQYARHRYKFRKSADE